jgi:group II intron reverse transcriptase/maturase
MRDARAILDIHRSRGQRGLPLERVYRHLFNPDLFFGAYNKIYRNAGAMTRGVTGETVDGTSLDMITAIIDLLRQERWQWRPVRRRYIPKADGSRRPLGIPTWGDKLVQEVLRALLEAYYEPRFSDRSHGFRTGRGCHTALRQVQASWRGTTWFIEGDIKGCFDSIDHSILLGILKRDVHDGRVIALIEGLLRAGYLEDWKRVETLGGTPQGGILSPLLANIYLNELDRFVEDVLIPAYTRGEVRKRDERYVRTRCRMAYLRRLGDREGAERLGKELRRLPSVDYFDPDFRRLKYVRYADDFLLGFIGPKAEAERIRQRIGDFLRDELRLELSLEKTLITHAVDEKASFLGYEIKVSRSHDRLTDGKRTTNGAIALLMPRSVVTKIRERYSRGGKVRHRAEIQEEADYTIIRRYGGVLAGVYNFYCLATNVGQKNRMHMVKWVLETSLTKTLAHKHRISVRGVYRRYRVPEDGRDVLRAVVERPGRTPLVATFGGFPLVRRPWGRDALEDVDLAASWHRYATDRSEAVQRLMSARCELCGRDGPVVMHHIRKLADLNRPGRRRATEAERIMSARRRKAIAVCTHCHHRIHSGDYDGPRFR